jgi:uncharacterized protein (TIGR02594 family)
MEYAFREYGVHEIPGVGRSPRIAAYLAVCGLGDQNDETPWCSSFANWCMEQAGIPGTRLPNARSWLGWSEANQCLAGPSWGCVTVLWRNNPASWQGHVAFYVGAQGNDIVLLGGNQSDAVSTAAYPRARVLGYRWPSRTPMSGL